MHTEFEEEFEILKSIYTEIELEPEKTPNNEAIVSITLYPSTCNDDESRYVTLCLQFQIPVNYPKSPPVIVFKNPRGLSETSLAQLHTQLMTKCHEDLIDTPMLFGCIDSVQEFLTSNNTPASDCPICLNSFHASDVFFRSKCFHYFHSQCLGKFLQNLIKNYNDKSSSSNNNNNNNYDLNGIPPESTMAPEFLCPVCREDLDPTSFDIDKLLDSPPPFGEIEDDDDADKDNCSASAREENNGSSTHGHDGGNGNNNSNSSILQKSINNTKISPEWLEHRKNMQLVYEKQVKQGGIIDLSQQTRKLLIISTPAPEASAENIACDDSTSDTCNLVADGAASRSLSTTNSLENGLESKSNNAIEPNASASEKNKSSKTATNNGIGVSSSSNSNHKVTTSRHYHHRQYRSQHHHPHHRIDNGSNGGAHAHHRSYAGADSGAAKDTTKHTNLDKQDDDSTMKDGKEKLVKTVSHKSKPSIGHGVGDKYKNPSSYSSNHHSSNQSQSQLRHDNHHLPHYHKLKSSDHEPTTTTIVHDNTSSSAAATKIEKDSNISQKQNHTTNKSLTQLKPNVSSSISAGGGSDDLEGSHGGGRTKNYNRHNTSSHHPPSRGHTNHYNHHHHHYYRGGNNYYSGRKHDLKHLTDDQ